MNPILSIQGGGIRGIIPCCALVELEAQTGKKVREVFSFIGGTSTGALLTAACAAGIPAADSLKVYTDQGKRIFAPENDLERHFNLVTHGRQFESAVLHQIVQLTVGPPAYDWKINDCPVPVLITATNTGGDPIYFTQDKGAKTKYGEATLVDAAVASACATTYHDPWNVAGVGWCADGGCSSLADPVYQVCVEALDDHGCYGTITPLNAIVVSLGTGYYKPLKEPSPPGSLLERVAWVTSALVGSSKTIAAQTVERHWPGILQVLNPQIPTDIDEADVASIPRLLEIGQEAAAKLKWAEILSIPTSPGVTRGGFGGSRP